MYLGKTKFPEQYQYSGLRVVFLNRDFKIQRRDGNENVA